MRKSVFGLVLAGATLAGAICSASPAGAINVVYDGNTYDVTTLTGSFDNLSGILKATDNVLWGNGNLSKGLAGVVQSSLGLPNNETAGCSYIGYHCGPNFAYGVIPVGPFQNLVVSFSWTDILQQDSQQVLVSYTDPPQYVTYAKATAVAVPWETDALSVIGSTILFAGGLWARNKFAKPLQK